jgi:purine catabolism regulator
VRLPIVAGDDTYGAVAVLADRASLDDDDVVAIEQAAVAIAVHVAQAAAFAEAQERFAVISLEQLIAGPSGDPGEIAERARSFGWDLHRPRAVLLASIDPPVDANHSTVLTTIAAAARATLGRDAIVWVRSATVAALIAPDSSAPAERREIAERFQAELDVRVRTATISIGVGRRVESPAELARSFDEASRAVDVGRWAKGRHATAVYDLLGIERLLASSSAEDLDEFVEHAIGPLLAYDRANGTDLVTTLGVWLETRNMAAASRQLHVHYNTLKNRFERIEAVLGPIVQDADRMLECAIAVHVAAHYDGSWSS